MDKFGVKDWTELFREIGLDDGRYRIQEEIARGGMGAVLRIHDELLQRTLAMKVSWRRSFESGSGGFCAGSGALAAASR